MEASPVQTLIHLIETNHDTIHLQLKDITQAESMLQLPFRGNCLNWVVGHILGIRGECLKMLDQPGTLSEAESKTYGYGSEPLTDADCAGDLEEMLKRLDESCEKICRQVASLASQDLEREVQIWRGDVSLLEGLSFEVWHEAYHTGQLELLRQLSGKNDKVI